MATSTLKFHIESKLQENGREAEFFIMGPCAPDGGPTDQPKYNVYPALEDWDFSEPLPVIYENMTIQEARIALIGLADARNEDPM